MLLDKPRLLLVGANHLAHQEVIGTVVAERGSTPRRHSHAVQNALVSIDQPYKLQQWLLAVPRRAHERRRFRDVGRHRDGDPAQGLDPSRDRVDQLLLLTMMLVEKQV